MRLNNLFKGFYGGICCNVDIFLSEKVFGMNDRDREEGRSRVRQGAQASLLSPSLEENFIHAFDFMRDHEELTKPWRIHLIALFNSFRDPPVYKKSSWGVVLCDMWYRKPSSSRRLIVQKSPYLFYEGRNNKRPSKTS